MAKRAQKSKLETLVKAVCAEYASDPSKPTVLISEIAGGGADWYVAVVRYTGKWGEGKYVVKNARGATLAEALDKLAKEWLGLTSAKQELRALYGDHF